MAITMQVDIVSAEKEIFSGTVEMLVASGDLGELGITPGHAPLLTRLKPGEVKLTLAGGREEVFYVSGGMLEVQPYRTTVLADEVERAEDLDEAAALAARVRAEEAIAQKGSDINYAMASTELARAAAQIRAIKKMRRKL